MRARARQTALRLSSCDGPAPPGDSLASRLERLRTDEDRSGVSLVPPSSIRIARNSLRLLSSRFNCEGVAVGGAVEGHVDGVGHVVAATGVALVAGGGENACCAWAESSSATEPTNESSAMPMGSPTLPRMVSSCAPDDDDHDDDGQCELHMRGVASKES